MLHARRWTGQAIASDGSRSILEAESVETRNKTVTVTFVGVSQRPMHVSVYWNGGSILSVAGMTSASEELQGNSGRVVWEEETRKLSFVANVDELHEVCSSQRQGNKFVEDP